MNAFKKLPEPSAQARTRLIRNKTALLVIDMHEKAKPDLLCASEDHRTEDPSLGIDRVACLIREALAREIPVFLIRFHIELIDEIARFSQDGAVIKDKHAPSALPYPRSSFEKQLKSMAVSTLVVAGYHASACVKRTTLDALADGFKVITSPEVLFFSSANITKPVEMESVLAFYREKTQCCKTLDDLLKAF